MKFLASCFGMLAIILQITTMIANACIPPSSSGSNSAFELGYNDPADPATMGYALNHLALNVHNLTRSMYFYREVLGMRLIFTIQASQDFAFAFLSYKDKGGDRTEESIIRTNQHVGGLLELLHFQPINDICDAQLGGTVLPASTNIANTFSHIGLVVPDIIQTQARLEQYGVRILKAYGEDIRLDNPASRAFGLSHMAIMRAKAAAVGLNAVGLKSFVLAADPDGNVLEIQAEVKKV